MWSLAMGALPHHMPETLRTLIRGLRYLILYPNICLYKSSCQPSCEHQQQQNHILLLMTLMTRLSVLARLLLLPHRPFSPRRRPLEFRTHQRPPLSTTPSGIHLFATSTTKMAPPATDNNLAENLQDQFRSVTVTSENDGAKLAMIHAMDCVMGVPGEKLLQQAGLLPPPDDDDGDTPKDEAKEEVPFAVFDNACGTGLIAGLLQKRASPAVLRESRFVCADLNANLVDIAKWRAERDGWQGTVETAVVDAQVRVSSILVSRV